MPDRLPDPEWRVRRRLRVLRGVAIALLAVAGVSAFLAVEGWEYGRGGWVVILLRLFFVPAGTVTSPELLAIARVLLVLALVLAVVTGRLREHLVRRPRRGLSSGNPAVRARARARRKGR